jgi:N-acetylmuramoyl-L-alanine amidase
MRRFLPRENVRACLLRGVYEQNLAILGVKTASPVRPRLSLRRGVLLTLLLGIVLFGHAVPLNPFSWRPAAPAYDAAPWFPPGWAARLARSDASVVMVGPVDVGQAAGESDAAEYQRLARGSDLKIRTVFGLGVKTIMIDPGHGGGATGARGKGGTGEKTITLDIARRLKASLERNTDYRIVMTREEDRDVSLKERVDLANQSRADLFISIHVNAVRRPIDMIETFYFGPSQDQKTLELATEVNEGSDYSYSEYNEVIKKITHQLKYQESRLLAQSIQASLYTEMKKRKADVLDHGVKRAPFLVLLGVEMPGVLVEVACLSNQEEEDRLQDPAYRKTIADSIEAGIIRYLGGDRRRSGLS